MVDTPFGVAPGGIRRAEFPARLSISVRLPLGAGERDARIHIGPLKLRHHRKRRYHEWNGDVRHAFNGGWGGADSFHIGAWLRLTHAVAYLFAIPYIRTLVFTRTRRVALKM